MRLITVGLVLMILISCDKVIDVKLPAYESQLVLEMYVEAGKPLTCLLSESLPYTDTSINKPVNDALVIFSDGMANDTLKNSLNKDTATGRFYNYLYPTILKADTTKTYSITISDKNGRRITGTTSFSQRIVKIDSIETRASVSAPDSFSVGIRIPDPPDIANYYRFLVGRKFNDFSSDPTDFRVNDLAFNGKPFSFFSPADYRRDDTVTVRVYSLGKEHYDYLESTRDARRANFNPFSQPGRIKSNVTGGLGIFTTIRFYQEEVIIK